LLADINGSLDPHERLEKLVVIGEEWTIDNGMLTPTLKIKRSAIEGRYEGRVNGWYAASQTIVWSERA
jgi:long-chain acyl-CoA synthetase